MIKTKNPHPEKLAEANHVAVEVEVIDPTVKPPGLTPENVSTDPDTMTTIQFMLVT